MEKGKEEKGGRKSKEEEGELKIDFPPRGSVCSLTLWFSVISTKKKGKAHRGKE